MAARGKRSDPDQLDLFILQQRIEQDVRELRQAESELRRLGQDLRHDHLRQMRGAPRVRPALELRAGPPNAMCGQCFNSCKQPAAVRIFRCARFEPLE